MMDYSSAAYRECWDSSYPVRRCASCGEEIRAGEERVSVGGESYHSNDSCYRCLTCSVGLAGRKVSRLGPGSLVCSSQCHRLSLSP